jgi:hypothetical protein
VHKIQADHKRAHTAIPLRKPPEPLTRTVDPTFDMKTRFSRAGLAALTAHRENLHRRIRPGGLWTIGYGASDSNGDPGTLYLAQVTDHKLINPWGGKSIRHLRRTGSAGHSCQSVVCNKAFAISDLRNWPQWSLLNRGATE